MSTPSIVIASAARTAVGSFTGAFANTPAHELGAAVINGVLERAGVEAKEVDEVILGQVLPAGEGQNPARQAAMKAGVPQEATAWGVNQLCGSGLRAVALGLQQIVTGDAKIIVAGGQESMSMAPHCAHLRSGAKMGDMKMVDTMIRDGLTDAFHGYHMGITAENIARQYQLTREEQDQFALASQNKAEAAQKAGRFQEEIIPFVVKTRKGDAVVDQDEYIRHGATLDSMAKLRPAFDKEGTVTAGNASGINDGAAATLLMTEQEATRRGIAPLARIVSWATAGVDPRIMGTGPIQASRKALEKAGWPINELELVEANEAFAAQACAVNKDLGWNPEIVNVNGGAIAIGHPIGASGARVLNTLLFEMKRRGAKKGLATLCIGGGMGIAMCAEAMWGKGSVMTGAEYRLCDVALDCSFRTRDARIEREQALAIIDLLESNTFTPIGHDGGPYRLKIKTADGRLALHVTDDNGAHVVSHFLSLTPFRRLLKDYTRICESYYDAMCRPGPERLEAIDMGRRGIHNEAAELLRERLATKVSIDRDTARRLFTLIYALLARDARHQILLN